MNAKEILDHAINMHKEEVDGAVQEIAVAYKETVETIVNAMMKYQLFIDLYTIPKESQLLGMKAILKEIEDILVNNYTELMEEAHNRLKRNGYKYPKGGTDV